MLSPAAIIAARTVLPSHELHGLPFRRAMAAIARAEVAHARADWERVTGRYGEWSEYGSHPSEHTRLKHEAWAATILHFEGHLIGANLLLSRAIDVLKAQRIAGRTSDAWEDRAVETEIDLRDNLIPRRRELWVAFLTAARRYHEARAMAEPRFTGSVRAAA